MRLPKRSVFHVSSMPLKEGRGYTQPLSSGIRDSALIKATVALVLLMFALQMFFANRSTDEMVVAAKF